MSRFTLTGPPAKITEWLDAVKPASSEILLQTANETRLEVSFNSQEHLAAGIARAALLSLTLEPLRESSPILWASLALALLGIAAVGALTGRQRR